MTSFVRVLLLCLSLLVVAIIEAQSTQKEAVQIFLDEAYNKSNLTVVDNIFTANYVRYPGETQVDELKLAILSLRAAVPDLEVETEILLEEGHSVAARLRMRGTFTNEFVLLDRPPIAPNHRPIDFVTHIIFHFDNTGKVTEEWNVFDNLRFLSQIGVINSPSFLTQDSLLYPSIVDVGMSGQNRERVMRYFDMLNLGNFEVINSDFKSDFVAHNPFGELDRNGLIEDLERLQAAIPNLKFSVQEMITEGNWTVVLYALEGTFTGRYSLPQSTVAPTGNRIHLPVVTFFRFEQEGLIAEYFEVYDSFLFLSQLGLLPTGS